MALYAWKNQYFFAIILGCIMLAGCGDTTNSKTESTEVVTDLEESADETIQEQENSNHENESEKVIEGTLQEKKDFMFTVETEDGEFYGLAFDETPEGYDSINNGDKIKVIYTGELSEVDAFTGQIIAIEKL